MQSSCFFAVAVAVAVALALALRFAGAMTDSPASFLGRFDADARNAGEGLSKADRGQKIFNQTHTDASGVRSRSCSIDFDRR